MLSEREAEFIDRLKREGRARNERAMSLYDVALGWEAGMDTKEIAARWKLPEYHVANLLPRAREKFSATERRG